MRKILDKAAEIILPLMFFFGILFLAYLLGTTPMVIVIGIHAFPLLIFCLNRKPYLDSLTLKQAEKIRATCSFGCIILAFWMLSSHDKVESYLESKLITGKIKTEKYETENDNGEDVETTRYYFIPKNKSDSTKKDLIDWWCLFIIFGSPIYVWYGSKRIEDKVSEKEKSKKL